jgi:hypothetical protein
MMDVYVVNNMNLCSPCLILVLNTWLWQAGGLSD